MTTGTLALVGGAEWTDGCSFDAELLAASGGDRVVVLPTGSAYENPARVVERATAWFGALGADVVEAPVLTRRDGFVEETVALVAGARFVYLPGSSAMHLRSVLKDSPLFEALTAVLAAGGVLAGSAAGADVMCDPMVDSRGGAFTVGLGVVAGLSVIPRANTWSREKIHRTVQLAPRDLVVAEVPEATALIRDPAGAWRAAGVGEVQVFRGGSLVGLDALP